MTTTNIPGRFAPALVAGGLGFAAGSVLRRMEREYVHTDTLSTRAVAAMYATYGAHGAGLAWACAGRIWSVPCPSAPARIIGTSLTIAGGAAALAGARPFGAGRQISGIAPGSLHTGGIYRYSRNPQYLGLGLVATGAAIASRSAFAGLLAAGVWAAYRRWVPAEEQHLARIFGGEYTTYQDTTARWIGPQRAH